MADITPHLLDIRANDGSRQFAELPETIRWSELHIALTSHPDLAVNSFLSDHVTQAIIDFTYRGYDFTVDTQFGE
jgi:hypothetical protein